MVTAFLVAFGVVFVAELGDKSQLMVLTLATRFPAWRVLGAITVATALIHLISVLVGGAVAAVLPTEAITVAAGLAFIGFGIWTLRGDDGPDEGTTVSGGRSPIVAAAVAFFLAELGDKTMLASMTLAARNGILGTWVGATVGMVAADAIAVLVGATLGRRLPARAIRLLAAGLFLAFGVLLVAEGLRR
ncbi:MAG: TMEM165/GDT1 family protein [Actinomycetes bacterium]